MKIICIGRNYVDHAKELNNPIPIKPLVFMKPSSALLRQSIDIYYPEFTKNLHYELELVIKISKNGKHVLEKYAGEYYDEIGLGIDFTARDIQDQCKAKGHPWEIAKAFDNSAVLGSFISKQKLDLNNINFVLKKDESIVQNGNSKDLIFNFDYLISYVSQYFTLNKGDFIFTGTPAGVGPVGIGDQLRGYLDDQLMLECNIR